MADIEGCGTMVKKIRNYGRRKAAFFGLAALVLSLGLILGACDHGLHLHDESAKGVNYSGEKVTEVVDGVDSSGIASDIIDAINEALNGTKTIDVKFEVENGGAGLLCSDGIVSTQDDSDLVYDGDIFANDFTITIAVPVDDEYLNIRWVGQEANYLTYIQGKLPVAGAGKYTIKINYNGVGNIGSTQGITSRRTWYGTVSWDGWGDFQSAKARATPDE